MSGPNKIRETYPFPQITPEQLDKIITDQGSAEILVRCAEDIGKALAKPMGGKALATNQIRAIFGEVRRIQGSWKGNNVSLANRNLILLKPKMKYRAEREGDNVRRLVSVLSPAIDKVQGDEKNFTRFVEFFEAILAYHKAYGGN